MYQKNLLKKGARSGVVKFLSLALMFQFLLVNLFSGLNIMKVVAAPEMLVYENNSIVEVKEVDFSQNETEDWGVKKEVTYAYTNDANIDVGKDYIVDATITIDEDAFNSLESETNYLKFQGVVKLGDDWTYTSGDSWPMLTAGDFAEEEGLYSAKIQVDFKDKAPSKLMEIAYEIVGVGFSGDLNISNVKVIEIETEEVELDEREPTVLSDLATEEDFNNWDVETGWDYYHGGSENSPPEISYDVGNQRLQVYLDYSANSSSGWSEAKVKYVPSQVVDLNNYNQISVDLTYPNQLSGLKIKFFSEGVIDKDINIDNSLAEDTDDGMRKITIDMGFAPTLNPLADITIGIVGSSTAFKGNVYFDNLVLSQYDAKGDFVKITSVVGEGTQANVENNITSIKLSDSNADDSAKALFTYLKALSENEQVLFGHQNDISASVNSNATLGDVENITGSISGIFGIDTLALAGSEAGGVDSESAMSNSIMYSKKAAQNGAIITLSTHMPNFTNEKIVKDKNGNYDFFNCDFDESKDLRNNSTEKILPGGEYNDVFIAYLDIIVEYAKALEEDNIPIIFRPFHENSGSWFWWGSTNSVETYKSLFRYTKDYMESQGVNNMLWVYSPNGPITTQAEYLERYPGDEYVDILAFDYYDDYNVYPATSDGSFFEYLDKTSEVVSSLAQERGKIAALSECGVRVMKKDGSDNEGLLVKGNPVREEASGVNWYQKVSDIAQKNKMPYYLVWANFGDTNFYVPYKYDDDYGHEMINEFIDYYNDDSSVFADGTNFYENMDVLSGKEMTTYNNVYGYMIYPFDMDTILDDTELKAAVKNAETVKFVIENEQNGKSLVLDGDSSKQSEDSAVFTTYTAHLTKEDIEKIGATDVGVITVIADNVEISKLTNLSLGKEKNKAPANVIEDFDYYSASNDLLDANYSSNSAAGCSSEFVLDSTYKIDGDYGGAFNYVLSTTGSEVWTGRIKSYLSNNDYSEYNAIEMWVKPDGNGQKLVVQLTDGSGEEFEVYLTDFVKGTKAQYVTVPFDSFQGKQGGELQADSITKFAIWCNSIVPEGHEGTWEVASTIYFDGIKAVEITKEDLAKTDINGLIITDDSLIMEESEEEDVIDSDKPDNPEEEVEENKGDSEEVETIETTEGSEQEEDRNGSSDLKIKGIPKTGERPSFVLVIALVCAISIFVFSKRKDLIGKKRRRN